MPRESSETIANLDDLWPLSTDFILDGDDHIRLIKSVLKKQFPGAGGNGFAIAITANEDEVNSLAGVTGDIQTQLDNITGDDSLIAPSGTVMSFYQLSPPNGWTILTGHNNSMMRVVDANGGGYGGSDSPISFGSTLAHTHTTGNVALTTSQMPAHTHRVVVESKTSDGQGGSTTQNVGDDGNAGGRVTLSTSTSGSGAVHNHGATGSSAPGVTIKPKYVNIIMATKD